MWQALTKVYEPGEAKAIVRMVLDVRFGLSLADILCGKVTQLSAKHQAELQEITQRLQDGEPVQYVLGQADFGPRTFSVAPGVLIPRPETYELCQWVVGQMSNEKSGMRNEAGRHPRILDIGTGSGCIACTLAADQPHTEVEAWDISGEALGIAEANARRLHVGITFRQVDILTYRDIPEPLFDTIVSNPPYICQKEADGMEPHVLNHEPHLALFVPDDDPLRFYRAISLFAQDALRPGGTLYFEINPLYTQPVETMLHDLAFADIETRRDLFGRERMIKCTKK